jgi:hypothetical protein
MVATRVRECVTVRCTNGAPQGSPSLGRLLQADLTMQMNHTAEWRSYSHVLGGGGGGARGVGGRAGIESSWKGTMMYA